MRFKGGGLHDAVAPGNLVETNIDYRAWRTHDADELSDGAPAYDLYRWEGGSGWMVYVGTVFGHDGPLEARKVKLPRLKPPVAWARGK